MCGIVGIVANAGTVCPDTLDRALGAIAHRGPDDRQIWIDRTQRVGLAHARLSIIDVEGGRQPLHNEDGAVTAIVNGEFYGFEAIRRDLVGRGHRCATQSDSEILLHLYEDHGTECVRYLRGEFSFVLWDARNRRLIAARDRFGIKPLFYANTQDALILASEVKGIVAAGHPARWDLESVHQAAFLFVNRDRTLFRDVRQIPPGNILVAEDGAVRIHPYWDLCYPRKKERPAIDEATAIDEVRTLVTEAVTIRLRADVPVSSFLSGGLDSSAVFGFAAAEAANLRAFTVGFADAAYDETTVAMGTAVHHEAGLRIVHAEPGEMAMQFRAAVRAAETIGVNWHGVARYLLCRAIHEAGFKVALAGEGGDELFAGYMQLRQDVLLEQQGANGGAGSHETLQEVHARLGYVPCWIRTLADSRQGWRLAFADDFAQLMADRNPYAALLDGIDRQQLVDRDRLHQSSYLWIRSVLANYILFAERLEMAHAVETRLPLLDHILFEYVRELPRDLLLRGTAEKYVLREAARPVLTDQVYRRTKHPFFAPPASNHGAEPQYRLLCEVITRPALANVPFIDADAVLALLDTLPRLPEHRRLTVDSLLLMVASLCVLQQELHVGL
jgi:asparagine synthase (glutamine-hydrolysing)